MASELRVNTSTNRSGLGTITYTDTGAIVSGIVTATSFSGGATGDFSIEDKITHAGDTNTAIRFPSADTITAETGGSERLRIDSSGRVLIGTNASTSLFPTGLQVVGGSGSTGSILIRRTDDGTPILRTLVGQSGQNVANTSVVGNWTGAGWHTDGYDECAQITMNADGSVSNGTLPGRIVFFTHKSGTGLSEVMRLTSAGNMGLGTNGPTKRLTVQAGSNNTDIAIFTGNDLNRGLLVSTIAANSQNDMGVVYHAQGQHSGSFLGEHIFKTSNNERLRIDKNGSVNFGLEKAVAFPSGTGIQVFHSSNPRIKLTNDTTGNGSTDGTQLYLASDGTTILDNKDTQPIRIDAGGSERLRITSTGVVALSGNRNQTAPTSYDDLTGSNQTGLILGSSGITDAGIVLRTSTSGTGRIYFGDNSGNDAGRKQGFIEYHNNGDTMRFGTNQSERVRITSDGKLGLGETSPDFKFHSKETGGSSIAGLFETNQTDAYISFQASGTTASSTVRIGAVGDNFQAFVNGAERFKIESNGVAHFSGDVKVLTGDIQMGNGRGINFSPTSDAGGMSSETFDDYEEGTWTPGMAWGGGSTGMTFNSRSGSYVKIGRYVYCVGQLDLTAKGSSTGNATFTGLPYTVGDFVSGSSHEGTGAITWWANTNTTDNWSFWVSEGTTTATIHGTFGNGAGSVSTTNNGHYNNNSQFRFWLAYMAA